jgi:hypothetical protein
MRSRIGNMVRNYLFGYPIRDRFKDKETGKEMLLKVRNKSLRKLMLLTAIIKSGVDTGSRFELMKFVMKTLNCSAKKSCINILSKT